MSIEREINNETIKLLEECETTIKNIGWTLGNDCPYQCTHCYSMSNRIKGADLNKPLVDRIINQVSSIGVETINLGGNEPLFTNGLNPKNSLLPYIIREIDKKSIKVGLTTSGISANYLVKNHLDEFKILNDVDISFDSPFEIEHNENRGSNIFKDAKKAMYVCKEYDKEHTVVMCAMKWNFSEAHIKALVNLAKTTGANVRINMLKPTERKHVDIMVTIGQYYAGYELLNSLCDVLDMTDPIVSGASKREGSKRCPCGRTSFRINSITPTEEVSISPCVYLHDFKVGDLAKDELKDLINSPQFKLFRKRNRNPDKIEDCKDCEILEICGGGCAAMAYLYNYHIDNKKSLFTIDPYCSKEHNMSLPPIKLKQDNSSHLVHMDYLCTWIGRPK